MSGRVRRPGSQGQDRPLCRRSGKSPALGRFFPAAFSCVSLTETSQEAPERPCGERMSWLKLELTGPEAPRVPGPGLDLAGQMGWPVLCQQRPDGKGIPTET